MLGDQAEKTKNPLKSAMRRRKAKTVTFNSSHQYHDYSDFDYSTDEEDLETEYLAQKQQHQDQQAAVRQASDEPGEMEDETAKVEPLKSRAQHAEAAGPDAQNQVANGPDAPSAARGQGRTSEEILETKSGDGPKKTSDGTVRDSFFKDDTVETKKITLTPNLLRDDTAPRSSGDSKELRQRSSLDKLEKDSPFTKDEKKKKDKKEKEKKPGAFRSLFSRKDKKKGSVDEDDDSWGKRSLDTDGQEKDIHEEETTAATSPEKPTGPQRNPSKLRKQQPRTEPSVNTGTAGAQPNGSGMDLASFLATEGKPNNMANAPPTSMRIVDPYEDLNSSPESSPQRPSRDRSAEASRTDRPPPTMSFVQAQKSESQPRPQEVSQARVRAVLGDSDSDDDAEVAPTAAPAPARPAPVPADVQRQQSFRPQLPGAFPDSYMSAQSTPSASSDVTERGIPVSLMPSQEDQRQHGQQQHQERLSESPVQISPVNSNNPPALMVDTSSQEEDHSSDRDTPSPELIEREDGDMHGQQDSMTTTTSAGTEPAWNDASLRAFFDSGSEVRDMLVVVYDKTDVVPAGPEHPIAGTLFKEQNAKLAEITTVSLLPVKIVPAQHLTQCNSNLTTCLATGWPGSRDCVGRSECFEYLVTLCDR
jgi:hypothetical protein